MVARSTNKSPLGRVHSVSLLYKWQTDKIRYREASRGWILLCIFLPKNIIKRKGWEKYKRETIGTLTALASPAPISCPNAGPRDLRAPAPRLTCSLVSIRIRPREDFCKRLESQTVRPDIQTPFNSCAPLLPSSLAGSKMRSTAPHCLQSLVLRHPLRVP